MIQNGINSMHSWGDDTFDWKGLNEAIWYMHQRMVKLARIGVHSKEKYGTARLYCYFVANFHSLLYPGYVYCQYKSKFIWGLDVYYGEQILYYTGLHYLIFKWQKYVYIDTYRKAVKKWPHLTREILCAADQIDWLDEAGVYNKSEYFK